MSAYQRFNPRAWAQREYHRLAPWLITMEISHIGLGFMSHYLQTWAVVDDFGDLVAVGGFQ